MLHFDLPKTPKVSISVRFSEAFLHTLESFILLPYEPPRLSEYVEFSHLHEIHIFQMKTNNSLQFLPPKRPLREPNYQYSSGFKSFFAHLAQPSPAQPSSAQPSPAQPSPAQLSPAQPSPAQPTAVQAMLLSSLD